MTLPELLTEWPHGEIVLTGHRIGLYSVVCRHQEGMTAEQVQEQFPTLSPGLIRQVLELYRQHRAEVDEYAGRCSAEVERQQALYPPRVSQAELQRRYEEKRAG